MTELQEAIDELLCDAKEARFSCPQEARKKAMDFLARREYGQAELIRKLAGKGYDRSAATSAVVQLTADNLQSDQRFAEAFVQSRINQGKGPVRIRLDLGQRGVLDRDIDVALTEASADWSELARVVRRRKFGTSVPADFKAKARQIRFLQYRGFEQDHAQAACSGE